MHGVIQTRVPLMAVATPPSGYPEFNIQTGGGHLEYLMLIKPYSGCYYGEGAGMRTSLFQTENNIYIYKMIAYPPFLREFKLFVKQENGLL